MAKAPRKTFYIYRILGEQGETVYIGKGSGSRLAVQKRRFQSDGEIIEWHSTEASAYKHEKRLIETLAPPLNQCSGGGGGIFGRSVASSEEAMFAGVAKIIRKLRHFQSFTWLGVEIKRDALEQLVADIAKKYGPEQFSARLARYNIIIENR